MWITSRGWTLCPFQISFKSKNNCLTKSPSPLSGFLPPGELCPVNGRSPGTVSTQHSSPRSDAASASGHPATSVPTVTAPAEAATLQTSDVVIHRKENEGFGFVIISSLNRPENASIISESLLSGEGWKWDSSEYTKIYYFYYIVWDLSSLMLCEHCECLLSCGVASGLLSAFISETDVLSVIVSP